MRSSITPAIVAMLAAATMVGAQAQTPIYVYNFNDGSAAAPAPLLTVDKVNGTATPNGSTLSALSSNFVAANITSFGGTTANGDGSDPAGAALAMQGGTADPSTPTVIPNNGKYLQVSANLVGFSKINFSFAAQATSTGFTSDQFQYSLDGTTFTDFVGGAFTPMSSSPGFGVPTTGASAGVVPAGAIQSFDLSSITGLNNDANAQFRIVFNGATSAAGNARLDNLIIAGVSAGATPPAVPEASTTISFGLLLALGLGGVIVARRKTAGKPA